MEGCGYIRNKKWRVSLPAKPLPLRGLRDFLFGDPGGIRIPDPRLRRPLRFAIKLLLINKENPVATRVTGYLVKY